MRALYRSPFGPLINACARAFGASDVFQCDVEVEVLSIDYDRGMALVRKPLPANCMVNLLRKRDGNPPLNHDEREVSLIHLDFSAPAA